MFFGGLLGILAISFILVGLVFRVARPRSDDSSVSLPPSDMPSPFLEYAGHPGESRRFRLNSLDREGDVIGRAMPSEGITLRIDESFPQWQTVSRRHARIYQDAPGGRVVIEDMGSQNGVYVQGRRTARNLLKDGWTVSIGGVEFVYHEPLAGSSPSTQSGS
jgi:pSer/pThr/pTyr-binding forkhead associated (FHA) protein